MEMRQGSIALLLPYYIRNSLRHGSNFVVDNSRAFASRALNVYLSLLVRVWRVWAISRHGAG